MSLDFLRWPKIPCGAVKRPGDRLAERRAQDCATGFAAGRQRCVCPRTHTAVMPLCDAQTVHPQHAVYGPCLARAAPQWALAQPHLWLAVSRQGFGPCPAPALAPQEARHFPVRLIRHPYFGGRCAVPMIPADHGPHGVCEVRQPDRLGNLPWRAGATPHPRARRRRNLRGQGVGFHCDTAPPDLARAFHIADLPASLRVHVSAHGRLGDVTVQGKEPGPLACNGPRTPFATPQGVALAGRQPRVRFARCCTPPLTCLPLRRFRGTRCPRAQAPTLQRLRLARWTDVVRDQIRVRALLPLLRVLPLSADLFTQLARVSHPRVVHRDDPAFAVARLRVLVRPFQTPLVALRHIPRSFTPPAVETRLNCGRSG